MNNPIITTKKGQIKIVFVWYIGVMAWLLFNTLRCIYLYYIMTITYTNKFKYIEKKSNKFLLIPSYSLKKLWYIKKKSKNKNSKINFYYCNYVIRSLCNNEKKNEVS
jgi:hypothetical protein